MAVPEYQSARSKRCTIEVEIGNVFTSWALLNYVFIHCLSIELMKVVIDM